MAKQTPPPTQGPEQRPEQLVKQSEQEGIHRPQRLTHLQMIFTLLLAVPFVLQIGLAIGLTSWLLLESRQQAVDAVSSRFISELSSQVYERLETFLETPHIVNQINADSVRLGQLDVNDIRNMERRFWRQIQVYDSLSSIGFGRTDGAYIASDRRGATFRVGHRDRDSPEGKLHMYLTDPAGEPTELAYTGQPNYDPRVRPWYEAGSATERGQWTDIFTYSSQPIYVLSAVQAFYDSSNVFQGVAVTDLMLSDLNAFLQTLQVGDAGEVFIMERSGDLVAGSTAERPFAVVDGEARRIRASDSKVAVTQRTAQALREAFGDFSTIASEQQASFTQDGDRYFWQMLPYRDPRGLDWLIVVVLPASDLTLDTSHIRSATTLALLALALLLFLGWLVMRSFIRPMVNLAAAATDVATRNGHSPGSATPFIDMGAIATAFKQMSEQLQDSLLQLEDQKAQLEDRNQELNQFTHAVSHDLKAPLRAIDNLSTWIEEDLGDLMPADNKAQMVLLRQRVARMEALINGLLAFSRVGRSSAAVEAVDLKALLNEIVDSLDPPAQFVIQVPPDLPTIQARRLLLQRVLANLIGNAIKHSDRPDGVISVSFHDQATQYEFGVADNGPGIAAEYHGRIFKIFETLKSRDRAENTGIGLSLVKKIVEMEGGEIWVESDLGQGALFRFTWPKQVPAVD